MFEGNLDGVQAPAVLEEAANGGSQKLGDVIAAAGEANLAKLVVLFGRQPETYHAAFAVCSHWDTYIGFSQVARERADRGV